MKKIIFCLFITLVIGTLALGGDGPFGLEMGMSLEEVTTVLGEAPTPNPQIGEKTLPHGYKVCAAKTPPEFESFILTITPKTGLCEIYLRTGQFSKMPVDKNSPDPKAVYPKLVDMVSSDYGDPVKEAKIPAGGDLFEGEPLDLATVWKPGKDGIESITLGWFPTSEAGSNMSILYVFNNRSMAVKEYPRKDFLPDVEVRP